MDASTALLHGTLLIHLLSWFNNRYTSSEDEQKYLQLLPTEPVFEVEQVAYLDSTVECVSSEIFVSPLISRSGTISFRLDVPRERTKVP